MLSRATAKKYQSLIISCLLHALILFLFLYTKMRQQTPEPFYPAQTKPAKVQFGSLPAQAPPVAQAMPQQPTQAMQQPQQEAHQSSSEQEIQSLPVKNIPQALPIPKEQIHQEAPSQIKPDNNRQVSAAKFMQAFRSAVKAERSAQSSSDARLGPEYVQSRLKQWSELHYRQRIGEALRKASKLALRTMQHTKSVNKVVTLTIPILKNGTLGDMSQYKLSGIFEVDHFLMDILQSTDFPPIPDRYNTDKFVLEVPLHISLKQGTGRYYLSV